MENANIRAPTFVHRDKILRLGEEIFGRWHCEDASMKEFILASLLIRNNKVLLVGLPGAGKSTLVRLIVRGLSKDSQKNDTIFGITIGAPEKTLQKVLVSTNIVKLLTRGEEEIIVRPIVRARIKFINEINRFSKSIQDALLSLLEEGYLEYGGVILRTPNYICFADMNPFRGDMDKALKARFLGSCYVELPSMKGSKHILDTLLEAEGATGGYPDLARTMPAILSISELEAIWDDVMRVSIPEDVRLFGILIISTFRVCKHNRLGLMPGFLRLPCAECEYSNEPCSLIQEPPDERAVLSLFLYARARAWLHGRTTVTFEDVVWAAPYVLAHRVEIKPLTKSRVPNPWVFLRDTINNLIKTRWHSDSGWGSWARSLVLACRILGIRPSKQLRPLDEEIPPMVPLEALREIERISYGEFGRGDLVLQQLYVLVREKYRDTLERTRRVLEEELRSLEENVGTTLSDVERYYERLKQYPAEIADSLMRRASLLLDEYRVSINLEAPLELSQFAKILAQGGIPNDIIERALNKSTTTNLEYRGKLLRVRRHGKNLTIFSETKELAQELRRSIRPCLRDEQS